MQSQIETRTRELMISDKLSPLQAWNQACRELGAIDQDPLDEPSGVILATPKGQTADEAIAKFRDFIHEAQSY